MTENMDLHQYHDVNRRGTVERLFYTTKDREGETVSKYANVYLPFDYSGSRRYTDPAIKAGNSGGVE